MSVPTHTTVRCSTSLSLSGVCLRYLSVLGWTNSRMCGSLTAPHGGITLATRVFRSQHCNLSNSCKLVRAPSPLCRYRPPHGSHMVQRLQALCPAHRLHTVPSVPPRPQPSPTLLLDAATQSSPHSAASADATTQLPLTEFFIGCIYFNDPLDRSVPPPAHGNASSASLPQPADIATICSAPCLHHARSTRR